jgi:hypothetical protein
MSRKRGHRRTGMRRSPERQTSREMAALKNRQTPTIHIPPSCSQCLLLPGPLRSLSAHGMVVTFPRRHQKKEHSNSFLRMLTAHHDEVPKTSWHIAYYPTSLGGAGSFATTPSTPFLTCSSPFHAPSNTPLSQSPLSQLEIKARNANIQHTLTASHLGSRKHDSK